MKLRDQTEIEENPDQGRWDSPYCSGFFVSPVVMVSATHCFRERRSIFIPGFGTIEIPVETEYVGKKVRFVKYGQVNDDNKVLTAPGEATIIAADEDEDIAVLRVTQGKPSKFYLEVAQNLPDRGDLAYAVGHPVGLTWSFSGGMITRVWHRSEGISTVIQTQVVSYYGSSGGPLLDQRGRLIGVCHSLTGGQSTITHWVGSNVVRKMLKEAKVVLPR